MKELQIMVLKLITGKKNINQPQNHNPRQLKKMLKRH